MKFAPLLAQFLYTHKRLDLPGIGSFLLDPSAAVEAEQTKQGKPILLEGVSFENNSSVKQSPDLIAFIAAQTGKIKALAAADLDSHLELAKQFLNIGKPFMFEGIGSLSKMQTGGFSFSPGQLILERMKDISAKETSTTSSEEPATDYRSIFYSKKTKTNVKRPLVMLLLLAGIGLAIWGGYKVYKNTTAKKKSTPTEELPNNTAGSTPDTSGTASNNVQTAPAATPPLAVTAPAGTFKFVIETAVKDRALKRFTKLKNMGLSIQMETPDSANFKLFFLIPAAVADTAHIIDSLRTTYTPGWSKAYVEN
ncbi:MAG: hypothetical protein ABL876_15320 [Chitinophagaceae bacterium]